MTRDLLRHLPASFARFLGRVHHRAHRTPYLERLTAQGLVVGERVRIGQGTTLDAGFPWLISIGDDVTISLGVLVLSHDASTKHGTGYTRIAPVTIGSRVFVGAHAIILPGVHIGDDAIVAAGAVVRANVPSGAVVAGVPARVIAQAADYNAHHRRMQAEGHVWDRDLVPPGQIASAKMQRVIRRTLGNDGEGYVR